MRDAFSHVLVDLALADPRVLLLTGDHGYSLFDRFRDRCPTQYLNVGVAEQNMVGMAAGLARVGFRPFVYALAAFVPIRTVEQIKLDIAHDGLPVVLIGDGAGLVYSHLGTSHQSCEDIACTRAIPGLSILSPADAEEMSATMRLAYNCKAPVYLRMGKTDRGVVHTTRLTEIQLGQPLKVRSGELRELAFLATGSMVDAAVGLSDNHYRCDVWSVPSIKPINAEAILGISRECKSLVVLEEHSVLGGLGSAVAEIVSEAGLSRVLRIGIRDRFSCHCGSYDYLLREHGLDIDSIHRRIDTLIAQA
jgi:transketolase